MVVTILTFGVAKDIIGREKFNLSIDSKTSVKQLKGVLLSKYVKLGTLPSFLLAVNASYAKDYTKLKDGDEVAIIPPTNGG